MSGCAPNDSAGTVASSGTTGAATSSAFTSGPDVIEGWPERWYGQYYEATDVELGVASPSSPGFHFFYNVRIEAAGVTVDDFDSTGADSGTVVFSPEVGVSGLVILPVEGKDYVDWPFAPTAHARMEIRPGPDCSELERENVLQDGNSSLTTLHRGRICPVVPCDPEQGINCKVTVDLCTDDPSPTTCDPA
jgi:hypothetical protein